MTGRRYGRRFGAAGAFALVLYAVSGGGAVAQAGGGAVPLTHQLFNGVIGPLTQHGDGTAGENSVKNPPSPICAATTSAAANVNTDCEGTAPHDETSVAVSPANALNLIGGANDYQLRLSSGGQMHETVLTRAHVSFDGGKTWTTYPVPSASYTGTGDPAVAFDSSGTAYMATLGSVFGQGRSPGFTNPDVLVAHSADGGKSWTTERVASGSGNAVGPGVFNDKEYVTAWGNGNAIVTWTVFNDGKGGSYISSPIADSVTHDGGRTWSAPQLISGSAPFCIGAQGGTTCDQNQFSDPVVASDGSVYVAFENTASATTGRDQYLVVKVDPATGAPIAGPSRVAGLIDGFTDYPVNVDNRPTYQDSEFRTNSAGDIAADPTNPLHLAVAWSDMRNSTLPAPSDPFAAKTNSDTVVAQSLDGGVTWSAPVALTAPGDQFMPWAAYDATGHLRIGYFDRSYDPANHAYGYTLASETKPGSVKFTTAQLTTALSDPTQGTRWFSDGVVNHATAFLGDYSGIAVLPSGVGSLWTDLRNSACFTVRCGSGQDAFFAAAP